MAIPFSDNFSIGVGNPIDAKYLNALNQPYASTGATNATIVESQRYIGLTVNIGNVEYWYKNGVTDIDLILKTVSTTGGGTITGATNGLTVFGKNIGLGGTIGSGNTAIITDARITPIGIVYNGDYSGTFINESLVSKRYVDKQLSGTTFHIPIYNNTNNGIQESSLQFLQFSNKLYNPSDLIIEAQNGSNLYLVSTSGPANTYLNIGYPALGSGYTVSNICPVGQAANIALILYPKGSCNINLITPTSSVIIGNSGRCGLAFSPVTRTMTIPQSGTIVGYGGDIATPNSPANYIIGGRGYSAIGFAGCGGHLYICGGDAGDGIGGQNCIGGDVIIESGIGTGTGANGKIKICNLPAKTAELNVLFYDNATGKISYGLASGGTGGGLITGGTNGLSVSGLNIKLGGTLNQCTQIVEGAGNTKGIEYFSDYSTGFSDRSLIDKGYANLINEKVSKVITQVAHGFIVGNVVGFSGGTYNKPISNGTYNGEILGIVTKVSGNTFELSQAGYISGLSGLTGNITYFLSDVTAGLMTPIEPTILGHVSKAMLIADTTVSGWMLPYAGYVISTGSTEAGGSNTKRITQTLHGFAVNEVIGWSGGTYNKAIANGHYNGEVIGIVNKIVNPNVFDLTQAGYVSGLTGLAMNLTYFLSDSVAGQLQITKPTVLGHIVRPILITDTPASGWVLPYPGYLLTTGTTTSGTTVGAGLGLHFIGAVLNVNVSTGTTAPSAQIPVKITPLGTNVLYVDSNDISGTTIYDLQSPAAICVGGVGVGYVLTGKSVSCILQDMLVPELFQTSVGTPTTSLTLANSGTYEIGCSLSQTLTPVYTAGAITPLYCSTSPFCRGGAANDWSYSGPSVASGFLGCSSCVIPTYVVVAGTQTWGVCTKYNAGSCIKGSKGTVNPSYPTICPLNSCTPNGTNSISGIYPYYYGKLSCGIRPAVTNSLVTGGTKVNNANVGTCKAVTFNSTGEWTWFAIPQTCNSMNYWCVDAFSRGCVNTSPSDTFPDECIMSISSGQLCWAGINYKVYMSGTVVTMSTVAFSTFLLP